MSDHRNLSAALRARRPAVRSTRYVDGWAMLKAAPQAVLKATDPNAPQFVLTFPVPDLDGDVLAADRGRWVARPLVNLEHGIPVGSGTVTLKSLPWQGRDVVVPIGTPRFASTAADLRDLDLSRYELLPNGTRGDRIGTWNPTECLHAAGETAELVAAGVFPGVSIEFKPLTMKALSRDPHPRTGRYPMRVDDWRGLGWAHAATPVNGFAQQLLPDVVHKAVRVAEAGRLPGGRPVKSEWVLKALAPYTAAVAGRPTAVAVPRTPPPATTVRKAMPTPEDDDLFTDPADNGTDPGATDPDADMDATAPPAAMKPGPAAYAAFAQTLMDAAAKAEADSQASDHPDVENDVGAHADEVRQLAARVLADGHSKFPTAGLDAPADAPPPADDEVGPPTTDDGALVMKAYPRGYPRFRVADAKPVAVNKAADPGLTARQQQMIDRRLARLGRKLGA